MSLSPLTSPYWDGTWDEMSLFPGVLPGLDESLSLNCDTDGVSVLPKNSHLDNDLCHTLQSPINYNDVQAESNNDTSTLISSENEATNLFSSGKYLNVCNFVFQDFPQKYLCVGPCILYIGVLLQFLFIVYKHIHRRVILLHMYG